MQSDFYKLAALYGVELLRAVTFCTEIECVKRNLLVGLGHKVAFCSVGNGDEITLYGIAFPASVCNVHSQP